MVGVKPNMSAEIASPGGLAAASQPPALLLLNQQSTNIGYTGTCHTREQGTLCSNKAQYITLRRKS
ncbi:MAG: hypothetical protein Aurels2KO_32950 [Aureliella sp.]